MKAATLIIRKKKSKIKNIEKNLLTLFIVNQKAAKYGLHQNLTHYE